MKVLKIREIKKKCERTCNNIQMQYLTWHCVRLRKMRMLNIDSEVFVFV